MTFPYAFVSSALTPPVISVAANGGVQRYRSPTSGEPYAPV